MSAIHELTISTLGHQGDGLAPFENGFVSIPFTLADEVVRAEIIPQKEHLYGKVMDILNPSPDRRAAPCPYFGSCGGCRLQHMQPSIYANWKLNTVNHLLEKNGFSVRAEKCFVTPPASRRRASFTAQKNKDGVHIGFHARDSHTLININSCAVLKPQLVALIEPLREVLNPILVIGQSLTIFATVLNGAVELVLSGINLTAEHTKFLIGWAADHNIARLYSAADDNAQHHVLLMQTPLVGHYGTHDVTLPPSAFMQASDEAEVAMLAMIKPVFKKIKNCADLFCGTGLFALNIYEPTKTVLAVDVDGAAIDSLHHAAQNLRGFKTQRRNLFRDPLKAIELKHVDGICLDPPRAGAKEQIFEIIRSKVSTIAYVSCNPVTLMRDARALVQGGFKLNSIEVFDQFLWSHHIECIGLFSR
jgi:23S rRNA (uracil1939-C5)-methyltransferase